ncbi:asparagine synthase (glutamine-hydrolyzing) [Lysinibacillus sp. NPDC096418]|uniref:asparagine synthase (glutamine-hydrolyzing) n=1 Tax=Lysinibacillus sp. NPDC096418 TaxID=3364138 RepID=UPI0037FD3BF1
MCGIAGVCNCFNGVEGFSDLNKMLDAIHHRGPNEEGVFNSKFVKFGMKRLSIIDISNGSQPMYSENGRYSMVYNGEIYNYIELKEEIEKEGYKFKTNSDTEVVLKSFELYGVDAFSKFNGMFALAIWDNYSEQLILARDRFGKKPLHYMIYNNTLYFGSEIKSIIINNNVPREINNKALDLLLTYNYVPYPYTLFNNIYKVPPGSYLTFNKEGFNITMYYDLKAQINQSIKSIKETDENTIIKEVKDILSDAVKIRLRSDVPVGAFLSGGVDSSLISCLMKESLDFKTFSIGFPEERFNELQFSQYVADSLKTDHYTKIVKPDSIKDLPDVIWHTDQPHGDISFLPYGEVAKLASEYVKVVLTGDGADEIFGGYDKYKDLLDQGERWQEEFFEKNAVFDNVMKEKIYSDNFKEEIDLSFAYKEFKKRLDGIEGDSTQKVLFTEIDLLLEGNNLEKPDRMTMAHSIEARSPFMDYRLVEYAFSIPTAIKFKNNRQKSVLKSILEEYLPYEFVNREKSMFTVPIGEWFKGELQEFIRAILISKRFEERGFFNQAFVKSMLDDHVSGKQNYTRQLRLLLIIELWFRIFIDEMYDNAPTLDELN